MPLRLLTIALSICIAVLVLLVPKPATAAGPESSVAGILTYSEHTKSPDAPLTTGATLFSGDLVETDADGKAQIQAGTIRLMLFGDSSLRLFRSPSGLIVELERGTVAYVNASNESLLVYALDLKIRPMVIAGAAGQITIVTRCDVRVISQHGAIDVSKEKDKDVHRVEDSKSNSFTSFRAVEYRDSWKPIPADYPDFDPTSEYHHSHTHAACPAADWGKHGTLSAGSTKAITIGAAAVGAGVLCIELCFGFESPDTPGSKKKN